MGKSIYIKAFGLEVKRMRETIGITQEELAEKLDISVKYIQKIENKGIVPGNEVKIKLINALGLSMDVFLNQRNMNISPEKFALVHRITITPNDQISFINAFLDYIDGVKNPE